MSAGRDGMLRVERDGDVLRLTLNRPERRNALHPQQLSELLEVLADVDDDVALLTLQGEGELAYSAGFDIQVLADAGPDERPSAKLFEAVEALSRCTVPTLSVVRGVCFGAGFDLALACDFRLGTPDARFAVPAARLGTVYDPRSVDRIRRLVGPTVTKELFMLGRVLDATRALRVGVLQEVVRPEELRDTVGRWVAPSREVASAHKVMVDGLEARHDRPESLWAELDDLRARSLAGTGRRDALTQFTSRPRGTSP
jgi:enoyl-CoA hydratase/carnithine racemase